MKNMNKILENINNCSMYQKCITQYNLSALNNVYIAMKPGA